MKFACKAAVAFTLVVSSGSVATAQDPLQDRLAASEEMRANRPSQEALEAAAPTPPPVDLPDDYVTAINQLRIIAPTLLNNLEAWERLTFHEVELRNYAGAATAQEQVIAIKGDTALVSDYQRLLDLKVVAAGGLLSIEAEDLAGEILNRDNGNVAARYYLGAMYNQTGSPDLALRLWLDIIETGDPDNFHVAGARTQAGDAAIRAGAGNAEAIKWYRLVAEEGNADAQASLGNLYNTGTGLPQDYAEAAHWFRKAAEQGDALGQNGLGYMYENGRGVPQDYAEAVKWYRLAAEQGTASAQDSLGMMYEEGLGVPQNFVAAHMWYNLGAANGGEKSGDNRDKLGQTLTPADLSEAQRRARVCLASNYQDCD